jgi:hypothetical protein
MRRLEKEVSMPGFSHGRLLGTIAVLAALLACPPAGALPPSDPSSPAGAAAFARAPALPLPALVPPANDDFGAAEAVTGLPFAASVSTLEATTAPDDPSCAGNAASVWYAYSSPVTVWLTGDTFGSDYNTTLSAYTGSPGSLQQVACDDDSGGGVQSEVTFLASAGVTYYLMAAGVSGGGALQVALDIRSPLQQLGVRTTRAYEGTPAAGPDHVAWAEWPRRHGRRWTAYVQETGERRVKANRPRTHGYPGGFDGETFAYQETRGRRSSIVLYDLATKARSSPPAGVNTTSWEWHPTISGDWLLFSRRSIRARVDQVVLRNVATGESIVLDRLTRTGRSRWSEAGQVSGNHAVWYRCTDLCRVYHYDIAARTKTMIPTVGGRHQYEPSVTDDGTLYYLSSAGGCGVSVRIVRRAPTGATAVLRSLPRRWDSFRTYGLENENGTTSLFYERVHCKTNVQDVFKVIDP